MRKCFINCLLFLSICAQAQKTEPIRDTSFSSSNYTVRKWLIGSGSVLGFGGSFVFLNEAWYKGYPRSPFHTFNDIGEWQQMDKSGHAWTAYTTSRITSDLWKWAGVSPNTSVVLGSATGLLYMLSIEYLDGRSAEWGWSWPDAGADITGTLAYSLQQLAWQHQKFNIKFSGHYKTYHPISLEQRADSIFGKSLQDRLLKDYNTQTYWLSFNIHSIFPSINCPQWLNIAFGYGAEGMFGGYSNVSYDKLGNVTFDRRDIRRYRQWYLSPDIDLTRIPTKNKFLRSVFSVVNMLKVPAPALMISGGKFKLAPIAF